MTYLDAEIEGLDTDDSNNDNDNGYVIDKEKEKERADRIASSRAMENLLITVKLRILDEIGKEYIHYIFDIIINIYYH